MILIGGKGISPAVSIWDLGPLLEMRLAHSSGSKPKERCSRDLSWGPCVCKTRACAYTYPGVK